ncbi:hypothetical protein NNA36_02330 [Shimia sp. CNT1-13L.2]|uniref:hypothetical protein n=1 Tax=Shimia sp. CNT1-13L.2 TaxID=2959663 RepID=UPI0020CBCDB4|nr:hypothetical protein [Shimia sp. CNT1-13L.2]MCP9480792.1 hypothetical protein [Shimia sp. CNT1-13L.2]
MKKLTISALVAFSLATFGVVGQGAAEAIPQTQQAEQSRWLLEVAFKKLSERDRIQIQLHLAEYGLYNSTLDGLWGGNTAAALNIAADMMEQNMGGELSLITLDRSKAFLKQFVDGSASAYMWGEGGECDGCAESDQQILTSTGNTVFLPENFRCNSIPRTRESGILETGSPQWTKAMDKVDALVMSFDRSVQQGRNISASDRRQIEEIISRYEIPYAAEMYGYALYQSGDLKRAHEIWATAAIYGEPSSASLLTVSLMGGYDEFKHLKFENFPSTEVITHCLRFAASEGVENAKLWLAAGFVGDTDVPEGVRNTLGIDTTQARWLLNSLSSNAKNEMANDISSILALADAEDQKERSAQERQAASALRELTSKCDDLVKLKGICWAQAIDEMETSLISQGYKCDIGPIRGRACEAGKAEVYISDVGISFNCTAFEICPYDFEEVSSFLIEQGLVASMEKGRSFETPNEFTSIQLTLLGFDTPSQPYWLFFSCGKGPKGQELCVEQPEGGEVRIVLRKNTYGAATPSFQ